MLINLAMALPSPPPSPGLALPLALLSALSLCLACPQKDKQAPPPPAVAREKEPNNQASQAQKLSQDTTLEAEISLSPNGRDEDWFELPATPQRWAQVEVTPSPGVDLALELVSPEGEVLLRTHQAGLGGG
ncbi:MAG: hypothetical protein FWB81_07070, partial [Cystobacterineae bacterium]|nr:hypothetical protein [Cystobacterineae bacterium]